MQKLVIEINIPDKPRYSSQGKFDDARSVLKGISESLLFVAPRPGQEGFLTHAGGQSIGTISLIDLPDLETVTEDAAGD